MAYSAYKPETNLVLVKFGASTAVFMLFCALCVYFGRRLFCHTQTATTARRRQDEADEERGEAQRLAKEIRAMLKVLLAPCTKTVEPNHLEEETTDSVRSRSRQGDDDTKPPKPMREEEEAVIDCLQMETANATSSTCTCHEERIPQTDEELGMTSEPDQFEFSRGQPIDGVCHDEANPGADEQHTGTTSQSSASVSNTSKDEGSSCQLRGSGSTLLEVPNQQCSICLCAYETQDDITWSSNKNCQHVFHHDCISSWLEKRCLQCLSKKGQCPRGAEDAFVAMTCPVCRQVFVDQPKWH